MSMKLPFFKKKRARQHKRTDLDNIPHHVAIIMDGNGRWAQKRGLPRVAGHKEGMDAVRKVVKAAAKCNVKILTLYAFSTENWRSEEHTSELQSRFEFVCRLLLEKKKQSSRK